MKCPVCRSEDVDPLTSMNKMWCFTCGKSRPFPLKPEKKSILNDGYVGDRDEHYTKRKTN